MARSALEVQHSVRQTRIYAIVQICSLLFSRWDGMIHFVTFARCRGCSSPSDLARLMHTDELHDTFPNVSIALRMFMCLMVSNVHSVEWRLWRTSYVALWQTNDYRRWSISVLRVTCCIKFRFLTLLRNFLMQRAESASDPWEGMGIMFFSFRREK